jgi:hypothetical protein
MQFEKTQKDPKCLVSVARGWLGLMNFVFGSVKIDDTRYAKIGLQSSLREIDTSEEELKAELEGVLSRIKAMQSRNKNIDRVKPLLMQHKKIRTRIEVLERKRGVLQNQMETLENSELNQQVLYSMRAEGDGSRQKPAVGGQGHAGARGKSQRHEQPTAHARHRVHRRRRHGLEL